MNPNSPGRASLEEDDIEMIGMQDIHDAQKAHPHLATKQSGDGQNAYAQLVANGDEDEDEDQSPTRGLLSGTSHLPKDFGEAKAASAKIWPQIQGIVKEVRSGGSLCGMTLRLVCRVHLLCF